MQDTIESLTVRNTEILSERAMMLIPNIEGDGNNDEVTNMIQGYIREIEQLRYVLLLLPS